MVAAYDGRPRDRLPTLLEVLNRRSQPPVDLWSFYVYMTNYFSQNYLSFYLECQNHYSLCARYIRDLRDSLLHSERESSRASSALLDQILAEGRLDDADSQRLSALLRGEDPTGQGALYRLSALLDAMQSREQSYHEDHSPVSRNENFISRVNQAIAQRESQRYSGHTSGSAPEDEEKRTPVLAGPSSGFRGTSDVDDNASYYTSKASPRQTSTGASRQGSFAGRSPTAPMAPASLSHSSPVLAPMPGSDSNATNGVVPSSGSPTANRAVPDIRETPAETIERLFPRRNNDTIGDGSSFVTRQDIRQSSHHILVTYFMPGAEREIVLPPNITKSVIHAIEVEGRDDPEVFDEAREYVFQAIEREAFPNFLAAKALGNVTPTGSLVRLVAGLFSLFAAFWVGFILIFLDWHPKVTRLWLILPFAAGSYGVFSSVYNLDPLMGLAGFSEGGNNKVVRVREPYVRQLIVKRSLYVLAVITVVAAIFVIIFALVPGHRL